MKEVIFTSDFATKKVGDVFMCDAMTASHLVHTDKVAEYFDSSKKEETVKKKK
jgi:hypothetical protein